MKRFLSLVLTFAMVLSLAAGICIGVAAEEEYTLMQEASITGAAIPELAVGDTLPALSYSVPAGANYTVSAFWQKDYIRVETGTVIGYGKYQLRVEVIANDGYAFDQRNVTLLLNGETRGCMAEGARGEYGYAKLYFLEYYSFNQPIDKAEVTYDIPELGKALGEATIPQDANYTLMVEWWDYNVSESVSVGSEATKLGDYAIHIRLFPKQGYEFTEDTEFWVNGELNDRADIDPQILNYWSDTYNFGDPISEVSITHADPELGKEFPVPTWIGENCTMDYMWYDWTAEETVAAGAMPQEGKEYQLIVTLYATAGYRFTDETKVSVNGSQVEDCSVYDADLTYYTDIYDFRKEITEVSLSCPEPEVGKDLPAVTAPADAGYAVSYWWYDLYTGEEVTGQVKDGGKYEVSIYVEPEDGCVFAEEVALIFNGEAVDESDYYVYSNSLDYYRTYSFAKPLDKFEVSYEMPQIGKAPGAITIPADAKYTVGEDSGWYDCSTGEKVTGVFEDGKRYELSVELKLSFGYETADGISVYANGKQTDSYGYGETTVYVYDSCSFAKTVSKVELPAWPQLEVGDRLPDISGTGENYSYYIEWEGYDAEGNWLEDDTVQDGAIYYAKMYAEPDAGYEFTDDTKVTLGGKSLSGWSYINYSYLYDKTIYNFGAVELIEKVELTTDIPGYGEKGGEVKIPEDAGYAMEEAMWGVATEDDYSDADVAAKAYTYGDHVLLQVQLYTEEGYLFSPNAVVTINGKEYTPVEVDVYEAYIYAVYDLGEITKPAATPETGDSTPVMLLSFLCLTALAGVMLLSKKRIAR